MLSALSPPFVVAHRFGNDVTRALSAPASGAALVEADVRLFRGRLEVRHLKTAGPLPLLWDRWQLASPFAARLTLDGLLAAAGELPFLLDLKGRDPRLVPLLRNALRGRVAVVCSRTWPLLDLLSGVPGVARVYSAGTRRELDLLARVGMKCDGVAVHERLLDPATVHALRRITRTVLSWPVNTAARARALVALGVDGLISDEPALVARAVAPLGAAAA